MDTRKSGRTIAIGDIHGCATALSALLDQLSVTSDDLVVTLGDYIDRGPDSHLVVERLLQLQNECTLVALRGNHEAILLDALNSDYAAQFWLQCGGSATLMSYAKANQSLQREQASKQVEGGKATDETRDDSEEVTNEDTNKNADGRSVDTSAIPARHIEFFRKTALAYETERHLFLHANYDPLLPIDSQDEAFLLWKHLRPDIPEPHVSGKTVFVGHTPQVTGEVLDRGHIVCIDTYCFGGGWLTAIDVDSKQTWQANDFGEVR